MGQAKRRGSREDRIAQAQAHAREAAQRPLRLPNLLPQSREELWKLKQEADRLFADLTTPTEITTQVSQFAQMLSSQAPMFLKCLPEPWSRQNCCDANVAKYMEDNGGKMLCGYRIWYTDPIYIEGERHVIWSNGEEVRDVSFVDTGEATILFVPDDKGFDEAPARVRYAFEDEAKITLAKFEAIEKLNRVGRLSPQESWAIMPTYERWLAGDRMSNLISYSKS